MSLGWPWDPPGGAGGSVRGEGSLGVPAQTAAPETWSRISGRKWMDGSKILSVIFITAAAMLLFPPRKCLLPVFSPVAMVNHCIGAPLMMAFY